MSVEVYYPGYGLRSMIQRGIPKCVIIFLLNITGTQFKKKVDKNCQSGVYSNEFTNLASAKETCDNDALCGKIEDVSCKGTDLRLCKKESNESQSLSKTCLHVHPRDKGKYVKPTWCRQYNSFHQ